jgi:hypothetical protein
MRLSSSFFKDWAYENLQMAGWIVGQVSNLPSLEFSLQAAPVGLRGTSSAACAPVISHSCAVVGQVSNLPRRRPSPPSRACRTYWSILAHIAHYPANQTPPAVFKWVSTIHFNARRRRR